MSTAHRFPVIFFPHGGGPWPFVDMGGMLAKPEIDSLRAYLQDLPRKIGTRPEAIVAISAHWEENIPTVQAAPNPSIHYDYYGFPPESYKIQWPAPGNPALADRIRQLLSQHGFPTATDERRGYDHGTFIPLKVSWPDADIPTVQVSLRADLDPRAHLEMGRALAPLRDEGVLILASGMSFHNLRALGTRWAEEASVRFDTWLQESLSKPPRERVARLLEVEQAPSYRHAHPREEHLLPLFVALGAAQDDPARSDFHQVWGGAWISSFEFG